MLTEKSDKMQALIESLQKELRSTKAELAKSNGALESQKSKVRTLEDENELFRKFYAGNMADSA